jgi:hypothetical protein
MVPQAPLPEDKVSIAENILLLLNFIQHLVGIPLLWNHSKMYYYYTANIYSGKTVEVQ